MKNRILLGTLVFLSFSSLKIKAQDFEVDEPLFKKKCVFTIGLMPTIVFNSFEKFSAPDNGAVLKKRNFANTKSVDREGKRNKGVRNFFFGVSLMYRVTNQYNDFVGYEVGFERGNTAFAYTNVNAFNFPSRLSGAKITSWINWNQTNQFSFAIHKAWGQRDDLKWYSKLKASYIHLLSIDDKRDDFTEEWINDGNEGGIWEGKFLRRNSVAFTPEFGRQLVIGSKGKNWLFYIGLSYQIGLFNMYELKYYSVSSTSISAPNSIKVKGNNLAAKFSLHIPISASDIPPRVEKIKPQPKKEVAKKYSQNNLVFLLDVSISMNADNKLSLLKQYMINMLDSLPPNDYITVITFSGATTVIIKPTQISNKEEIKAKLLSITPHGSTNVNRGLDVAYNVLSRNYIKEGNNRIIIATDGEFKANRKTKEKVGNNYGMKGIKLSIFHFVANGGSKSISLKELSAIGGGNYAMVNKNNINDKLEIEYKQEID